MDLPYRRETNEISSNSPPVRGRFPVLHFQSFPTDSDSFLLLICFQLTKVIKYLELYFNWTFLISLRHQRCRNGLSRYRSVVLWRFYLGFAAAKRSEVIWNRFPLRAAQLLLLLQISEAAAAGIAHPFWLPNIPAAVISARGSPPSGSATFR